MLLNARAGARPTITGVERWTAEVLGRLQANDPIRYRAVWPRPRLRGRMAGQLWEQTALPSLARALDAAAVLSPANLAPAGWSRNVVVVHDAAVLRHPEAYTRAYRAWHVRVGLAVARRALAVITVSEFSRRELADAGGIDPARVAVIPGGVGPAFRPDADPAAVAARHGLRGPYVLTIATADARKNLRSLATAARRLARRGIELAWAGDTRSYFAGDGATGDSGLRPLGYVADEDLPALYAGASAFVLPSRYEGFGLTCLEAMACGTPVVAADRAALPETCAGAAMLVDPDDGIAVADALERVLDDAPLRAGLRAAGLARAGQLRWDDTARAVDALLARVTAS